MGCFFGDTLVWCHDGCAAHHLIRAWSPHCAAPYTGAPGLKMLLTSVMGPYCALSGLGWPHKPQDSANWLMGKSCTCPTQPGG